MNRLFKRKRKVVVPKATAGVRFPEPPVLVGNPRLGSAPKGLAKLDSAVADSQIDGGEVDGLVIRGASVRGDDHRYYAETRQDSFAVTMMPTATDPRPNTPVLLVGVADGVGSQPLSHIGSATACRLLAHELRPYAQAILDPKQDALIAKRCQEVMEGLGRALVREAQQRTVEPKALSTTLSAALFGSANGPARRVVIFSVGDSPAYVLRGQLFEACVGVDDGSGLSGTAIDALPTSIGPVQIRVHELMPGDVVVLCTDGLGNPMRNAAVREQLAQWWSAAEVPGLAEYYWQLSFRAQSFGDDRTAVCVWVR